MTRSSTGRNVVLVTVASLGQLFIQFVFLSYIARYFGTKVDADALAAALALPAFWAAFITGSLAYVLVPDLVARFASEAEHTVSPADATDLRESTREVHAWQFASYVGVVTTLVGLLASAHLFFFASSLINLLYPSFSPSGGELAVGCLRILSIQVVLTGWISWAASVHHSRHHFVLPALGGVLGTGASLWIAIQFGASDILVFAWAINLGSLISVLVHVAPIATQLAWPRADWTSLARVLTAFWPLLLGSAALRFDPVVDRMLADRVADPGAIANINFSQKIVLALLMLGTSSLSLIAFPQLAERFAAEGRDGFRRQFALVWRRLILLVTPIAVGTSVFAVEIVRDLLERDEFSPQDTRIVAWLVILMMGMFVGASAGEMIARAYYVLGDTRTPTVVGVISLLLGWGLKIVLLTQMGISGIAIGLSAYFMLSASTMLALLVQKMGWQVLAGSGFYMLQAIVASSIACGACFLVFGTSIGSSWTAAPVGAFVYFVMLWTMKNEDMHQAWVAAKHRLGITQAG